MNVKENLKIEVLHEEFPEKTFEEVEEMVAELNRQARIGAVPQEEPEI